MPLISQSGKPAVKLIHLADLRGKVVMLQFTASWCGVCRKEMPFIEEEIWLPGKEKGLVVIGIDRDEPESTVLKFRDDMKITYPLALDPGADIFGLYARKEAGVTRNIIIDRKGRIIFLTRLFEREEFDENERGYLLRAGKKIRKNHPISCDFSATFGLILAFMRATTVSINLKLE